MEHISSTMAGARIRAQRQALGIKQGALAKIVGISPSYLNLIEHNRRKIGGKLMLDIAAALGSDPAPLAQGAEAAIVGGLVQAAGQMQAEDAERDGARQMAERFPGWSDLVVRQAGRIKALEQTVATLSDRLAHDPHLSASLHDVISTVTAIRSTAAILSQTPDLEREWRDRFQRNVFEESQRLVDSSQRLVTYLERAGEPAPTALSPRAEFDGFLEASAHHFPALEGAQQSAAPARLVEALGTAEARGIAKAYLTQYRRDAKSLPLDEFAQAAQDAGFDPGVLADRTGADIGAVFRRLASLPMPLAKREIGLAVCDGAGALVYAKPIEGFALPRLGAACALWPLFQALARPMTPIRRRVTMPGPPDQDFLTFAFCEPRFPGGFDAAPVARSYMLILPAETGQDAAHAPTTSAPVGVTCAICPRADCPARREAAIIALGFDSAPAVGDSAAGENEERGIK